MSQVFEYTHPVINNDLAINSNNPNPRRFPTLQSWYNVINDYEFRFRCPIILKNSHKNKHFTFACHLKDCDFKILLSYSGGNIDFTHNHAKSNTTRADAVLESHLVTLDEIPIKKEPATDIINSNNNNTCTATTTTTTTTTNLSDSEHDDNDDDDSDVETIKKYTDTDADSNTHETDPHVTAAIAAAVAAVEDSTNTNSHSTSNSDSNPNSNSNSNSNSDHPSNSTPDPESNQFQDHFHPHGHLDHISDTLNIIKETYYDNGTTTNNINNNNNINNGTTEDDINSFLETSVNFINENPVIGPFVVTKIFPYHNHALKDNMPLEKFILTKIPKILQNDLNFDVILENLYKKGNNSMNKFKVSLFVTDSGLLDIIKQRYHIDDKSITKEFLSLISRRVTTYKARFVLKKKKMGQYHDQSANIHLIHHNHVHNSNVQTITNVGTIPSPPPPPPHPHSSSSTATTTATTATATANPPLNGHIVNGSSGSSSHVVAINTTGSSITDDQSLLANLKHTNDLEEQLAANQALLNVTKKILSHGSDNAAAAEATTTSGTTTNTNNDSSKRMNESLLPDQTVIDLNNASHVITSDLQNAAQAAINEAMVLKRRLTNDESDLDSYKRSRINNNNNNNHSHNSTSQLDDINIGDIGDDKLPHEVAEQLRLLSSHFKDVDVSQATTSSITNTTHSNNLTTTTSTNGTHPEDDLPHAFHDEDDNENDNTHGHNDDISSGIVAADDSHILDENIQPELRGQ